MNEELLNEVNSIISELEEEIKEQNEAEEDYQLLESIISH